MKNKKDVLSDVIFFKPGKSIYTYMSSFELNHRHQQLTARYGIALHDTSLSIEERRLKNLIAKRYTESKKQERQYRAVCSVAREYLIRQMKEYALIICLAMRKNNYFGMMGEQRVMTGFARNIFDIPNVRMYQYHIDSLDDILEECDKRNGNKTGEQYLHYLKQYKFNLFGREYCHYELTELNFIFQLMETDMYLFRYNDINYGSELILGIVSRLEHANDKAFIIKKELIRTPQFILNKVGKIHNNGCLIRYEAIELAFHTKWANFFRRSRVECKYALLHANSEIREGLNAKTLSHFDCNGYSDVLEKKEMFIQDMVNGILNHEIGHHITNADRSAIHNAFGRHFYYGEQNIGGALDEALADWAPVRDKRKGPFAYFLELSKTDLRRAVGNIYMYMSDNWFVDAGKEEEFLCFQSHTLVGLAFMFVNADGSVDFARMERDSNKIYDFLLERFNILTGKAIGIIQNAIYDLGNRKLDYKTLEDEIYQFYEYKEGYTLEELLTYGCFWRQIFLYLKKYSKDDGWDKYQKLLSEEGDLVENMILKMADSDNKYKSLKEYIIERSKEIGVIKIQPEIEYRTAVKRACEDMNLSEDVQEQVRARFKEIIEDNKSIDVKINYQGSEDPFITVLQEMMIKRGYVENGILIGQFGYDDVTSEDVKEFIFKELEHLRDQLESGMYHGIAKLSVRNSIRSLVDELLTKVKFSNGENIASKIDFVKYSEIEYALIEAVIPIKRGYFDYNTTQAIYRISKELHPYGGFVEEQCVIDRYFLDSLIEIYL